MDRRRVFFDPDLESREGMFTTNSGAYDLSKLVRKTIKAGGPIFFKDGYPVWSAGTPVNDGDLQVCVWLLEGGGGAF